MTTPICTCNTITGAHWPGGAGIPRCPLAPPEYPDRSGEGAQLDAEAQRRGYANADEAIADAFTIERIPRS